MKARISRVKKPLPNLGGRATLLPPLGLNASKRNSASLKGTLHSRTNDLSRKIFNTTSPEMLNQKSSDQIPINSMYASEVDRSQVLPPSMEDSTSRHDIIKETMDD